MLKILGVALLFLGESLAIYAEVAASRAYGPSAPFLATFIKMTLLMTVAGSFLIAGYMLGYRGFKDIWIVTVASVTSILIMEPIINYAIFHELPARGPLVGLILGGLGLIAAVTL